MNTSKRMDRTIRIMLSVLMPCLLTCIFATAANAQTTAFTYQGHLSDVSIAANGTYQMQFALYDAVSGGAQQGATINNSSVTVDNGIFTVQLDLGSTPFAAGADRWIEIAVKKTSETSYTTLTPRQRITSAPYVIRTVFAATAGTADSMSPACNECVADNHISAVAGSKLTGTVADARLSSNVVLKDAAQTLTNKTLTAPIISTISNTGILTLPTSTDTLVGRTTTDTLINKTMGNNLNLNNNRITNLSPPTSGNDAANKDYVGGASGSSYAYGAFFRLDPFYVAGFGLVAFNQTSLASGVVSDSGGTTFTLTQTGVYEVTWQATVAESVYFSLEKNEGSIVPVVGRSLGNTQIVGNFLIDANANDVLSVRNLNPTMIRVSPIGGTTTLVIKRIR